VINRVIQKATAKNPQHRYPDADGGNPVRLTDDPAWDGEPAWSLDGTRITFSSKRSGAGDLYTMNTDGSDVRRLTDDPARDL